MEYKVKELNSKREIMEFIKFPRRLYSENSQFVPPLDKDEYKALTASPSLNFCLLKMWGVYDESNEMVGRVAAIINPRANSYHDREIVRFGWLDFIENKRVAELLFDEVSKWGGESGMGEMRGPLSFNTWGRQGLVIDGFNNTAQVNYQYNYPYYQHIIESLGFSKRADWIQYSLDAGVGVPEDLYRINELLMERYNLKILDIDKVTDQDGLIRSFFKCYNSSFSRVENFVPLTETESLEIGKEYFSQLRREMTCILTDDKDEVVAFGIATPNLSKAFRMANGKLFPFGWLYILLGYLFSKTVDLAMVGATQEWQQRGVSSIVHTYLATNFQRKKIKVAITNPQLETNSASFVWNKRYKSELYMRRRCYTKRIL